MKNTAAPSGDDKEIEINPAINKKEVTDRPKFTRDRLAEFGAPKKNKNGRVGNKIEVSPHQESGEQHHRHHNNTKEQQHIQYTMQQHIYTQHIITHTTSFHTPQYIAAASRDKKKLCGRNRKLRYKTQLGKTLSVVLGLFFLDRSR